MSTVNIIVRGKVVGTLTLHGYVTNEGTPLRFGLSSNGIVKELACMCEGAFTRVAVREQSGEAFFADKLTYRNEAETPDKEKIAFLQRFAEHLGKRVEANIDLQERSRS